MYGDYRDYGYFKVPCSFIKWPNTKYPKVENITHLSLAFYNETWLNSGDADEMPLSATSHQGLHYLYSKIHIPQ